MQIILKFILKNIKEKKFRTFLMLFSIVISSALFFASSATSTTSMKIIENQFRQSYGDSEIVIRSGEDSPSQFFSTAPAKRLADKTDYIIGAIQGSASFKYNRDESISLSLLGIDIHDLNIMNPVSFFQKINSEDFSGMKMIISKNTAEKYDLSLGDTFKIDINGITQRFRISGISYPIGLFADNGDTITAVIPRETLSSIYNAKGTVNVAYIKSKAGSDKNELMGLLTKEYKRYIVKEPFTKAEISEQTDVTSVSLSLMTSIVALISVFIIYSSFKVIIMERLPVIGTFRSIGATRKMTDFVLLIESVTYGVMGGLLGCGLGIGILYAMTYFTTPEWQRIDGIKVYYSSGQLLQAFLMAIVLCFISSVIPILKVSKIPVKDIIFDTMKFKSTSHSKKRLVSGVVLLTISLLGPHFVPRDIALIADMLFLVLSIAAVIILIPFLTNAFVAVFERVYIFIFGNVGVLAAKNLKENKSLLSNISLLSIGIASLLMINALSSSISGFLTSGYDSAGCDIFIADGQDSNKNFGSLIRSVDGVKSICMTNRFYGVEISGSNDKIGVLESSDGGKVIDYSFGIDIMGDAKKVMGELDSGRNIVISKVLSEKFKLNKGDIITLKMKKGDRNYKVIGFLDTMQNTGNYALVSDKYVKLDMATNNSNMVYIKTHKASAYVKKEIVKQFAQKQFYISTIEESETREREGFAQLFSILKAVSLITMLIGIFGVLNNLMISFIERRRSFAMFRSVGMSRIQIVNMIFLESLSGGILAGTIGVLAGELLVYILPYMMKAMNFTMSVTISPDLIAGSVISAIIIMITASVAPALKVSNLNIVETIK